MRWRSGEYPGNALSIIWSLLWLRDGTSKTALLPATNPPSLQHGPAAPSRNEPLPSTAGQATRSATKIPLPSSPTSLLAPPSLGVVSIASRHHRDGSGRPIAH